jgi:CubicO group peptidase (beta-lactamase class C family)
MGYLLLGRIIENVTGLDYLDYINEHFCEPLEKKVEQAKTPKDIHFYSLKESTSSFGLQSNSTDLAQIFNFYNAYASISGPDDPENCWSKDGSLPYTTTALVRSRFSGCTIVLLIPERDNNSWVDDNHKIRIAMDHAAYKAGL